MEIKSGYIFMPSVMNLGILSGLFILSAVGCSAQISKPLDEPDWVRRGNRAFLDKTQRSFYGVGVVSEEENNLFPRLDADRRARTEIATMFEPYAASLMRDYATASIALSPETRSTEEDVEVLLKTFSRTSLSAVVIIDHWFDPQKGSYYSLARLSLDRFREKIRDAREVSTVIRGYVHENAQKAFNALDQESAKRE